MGEEKRIYAIVAATVQTPRGTIVQPPGRQIAQACHVVSKLRHEQQPSNFSNDALKVATADFESITTIILQGRDSAELAHIRFLLSKNGISPETFYDTNDAYGSAQIDTAVAAFMTPTESVGITDYLPMWGKQ